MDSSNIHSSQTQFSTLVVSNFGHNISWLKKYGNPYVVYDHTGFPENGENIISVPDAGHNVQDILSYIVDNYDDLPEVVTFCKADIFPRHISKEKFEELKDKQVLIPLFDHLDHLDHQPSFPLSMRSSEGMWSERNDGAIVVNLLGKYVQSKYFMVYDDMLQFVFSDAISQKYITFSPGANYVVPKNYILKYSKAFYKNLLLFFSYYKYPIEAYMIERLLYTMWVGNLTPSDRMGQEITEDNFSLSKDIHSELYVNNMSGNMNVVYEIRMKDLQAPYLYIPLTQKTLINKPECGGLFSCNVDDFITIHDTIHEAKQYISDNILPSINDGRAAEFIIDTVYKKR